MKPTDRLKSFARNIAALNVPLYAGNAGFFLLLSIFPLIALLLSLMQHLPISREGLFEMLQPAAPAALLPFFQLLIDDIFDGISSFGTSIFNAVAALWASSTGLHSIMQGLNRACGVPETRPWLKRRALCLLYTLLLLLALVLTLVLHGFGQQILVFLEHIDAPIIHFFIKLLDYLNLYSAIFLTLLFAALYLALPNCKNRVGEVLPGAFCAALAWIIFSNGFSYYVNSYSQFSVFYGSIGTILLTMLWLFFCLSILFFGAYLNYLLFRSRKSEES